MTTDAETRFLKLRQWMERHCVTYRFVAPLLGVTEGAVPKILKGETMPTKHYKACVELGFPVDLLPRGQDLKRGPRAKIPNIPAMRRLCQSPARV